MIERIILYGLTLVLSFNLSAQTVVDWVPVNHFYKNSSSTEDFSEQADHSLIKDGLTSSYGDANSWVSYDIALDVSDINAVGEISWTMPSSRYYVIGFSDVRHTVPTQTDDNWDYYNDMKMCVEHYGSSLYLEGSAISGYETISGESIGDIISLKKVGNSIKIFINGVEPPSNSSWDITGLTEIYLEASIRYNNDALPPITLDWGPQVSINPTLIEPAKYLGVGGEVTVEGAGAPSATYFYDWSDVVDEINDPDQDNPVRTGLIVGTYSVTARDQADATLISPVTDIEIIESYDFSFRSSGIDRLPNRVLKKTTSSATNEWFSTNHQLEDGKELSWVVGSAGDAYQVGLSNMTETAIGGNFDLGWSTSNENGGTAKVIVAGIEKASTSLSGGDVLRIVRSLNTVYFLKGNALVHTEYAFSGSLFVEGTIISIGVELPRLSITTYGLMAFGSMTVLPSKNADLNVTVIGATGTPTFVWTGPGIVDASLEDQSDMISGVYSVSITDQGTGSSNLSFTITTDKTIEWDYMTTNLDEYGVNGVQRISGSGTTSSWARSKNAMIGVGSLRFIKPSGSNSFMVGLSEDKHTEGSYYAIDYGIEASSIWYIEGHEVRNEPEYYESFTANAGDVLEIERVDEGGLGKIYFYKIDPVTEVKTALYPHAIDVSLTQPLYVEVSISGSLGILPELEVDFGVPLSVSSSITHTKNGMYEGSINQTVEGGAGTYNYKWNNGEISKNINFLETGNYSVTITSGIDEIIKSYDIEEYIIWDATLNNGNEIIGDGEIKKTISTGTYGSNLSETGSKTIISGDGKVSFKVTNETDEYIIGLTSDFNDADNYHDIDYAVEIWQASSSPSAWFYHENSYDSHWTYVEVGDVVSIEKEGTKIRYYVNGIQTVKNGVPYERDIVTDGLQADQTFIAEASIDQQNAIISDVIHNFSNPIKIVSETVTDSDDGLSTGSIILEVEGGNSPYFYSWDNQRYSKDIDGLEVGKYTVTITDSKEGLLEKTFEILNKVTYSELTGMAPQNGGFVKTAPDGEGNSKAFSDNSFLGNGGFQFEISDISSRFVFGISETKHETTTEVDYGFKKSSTSGNTYNMMKGTVLGSSFTANVGDVLRVERDGDIMSFYRNDIKLADEYTLTGEHKFHFEGELFDLGGNVGEASEISKKSKGNSFDDFLEVYCTLEDHIDAGYAIAYKGNILFIPVVHLKKSCANS